MSAATSQSAIAAPHNADVAAVTVARLRARPRVKTAGFPPMPIDMGEFYAADLTAAQRGAWMSLRTHLWFQGELPTTAKGMAEIARVHIRTWHSIEAAIAPHFDIDESGRWRHYDLEEAREAAIASRSKRAEANARNAAQRWGKGVEDNDANGNANGNAKTGHFGPADCPDRFPIGSPDSSGAQSLSDRQDSPQSKENIEESDGRTDATRGPGVTEDVDRDANSDAATATGETPATDGKNAITNTIGNASSDAGDPAMDTQRVPTDAEIIAGLKRISKAAVAAGGVEIPAQLLNPLGIEPVRALAELCDFEHDVLPAFEHGLRRLNRPLDTLRARFMHEMAMARRDDRVDRARPIVVGGAALPVPSRVFIVRDSPQWEAWRRAGRRMPTWYQRKDGKAYGWYVESEWPPGADPPLPIVTP